LKTTTKKRKLPPVPTGLAVRLYGKDGKLFRVKKFPDPRKEFCKAFNSLGIGCRAEAVTAGESLRFRVGVYKPGEEDKVKYVGPKFTPCPLDAAAMYSAIKRFNSQERRLRIGIFLVDNDD
jgi:hypothetical protein